MKIKRLLMVMTMVLFLSVSLVSAKETVFDPAKDDAESLIGRLIKISLADGSDAIITTIVVAVAVKPNTNNTVTTISLPAGLFYREDQVRGISFWRTGKGWWRWELRINNGGVKPISPISVIGD